MRDGNALALVAVADRAYRGSLRGRAGSAGIILGQDLVVHFDVEQPEYIVGVYWGPTADPLQIAAIVGFDAAEQIASQAATVTLPDPLPAAAQLAGRAAVLSRLSTTPVLRHARHRWAAEVAICAHELADYGLDTGQLRDDNLRRFRELIGPAETSTLAAVAHDELLTAAARLGFDAIDPFDSAWPWFDTIASDLPDDDLDLIALLERTPSIDRRMLETDASDELSWLSTKDADLPAFLGGGEPGSPEQIESAEPGERLTYPLLWALIDEERLPENDDFEHAVRFEIRDDQAEVTVEGSVAGDSALYVRIVCDGETLSLGALLAHDDRWEGTLALPEDFDPVQHHCEIVDSLARPVVLDLDEALASQWALLAVAQDIEGMESTHTWRRADEQLHQPPE